MFTFLAMESINCQIDRWIEDARAEVDDVGGWRNSPGERAHFFGDHAREWPGIAEWLEYDTTLISSFLLKNFPKLDPSPLENLFAAIEAWHVDHDAGRLPPQNVLESDLQRCVWLLRSIQPAADGVDVSARHSPDFRSVCWFGVRYAFTATQAAIVKTLWEAWENGTTDVGDATLLEGAEATGDRLRDVFRHHAAWGNMIVSGDSKGSTRLHGPNNN